MEAERLAARDRIVRPRRHAVRKHRDSRWSPVTTYPPDGRRPSDPGLKPLLIVILAFNKILWQRRQSGNASTQVSGQTCSVPYRELRCKLIIRVTFVLFLINKTTAEQFFTLMNDFEK